MSKFKTSSESICESRKIVMPEQINPHGTLFGGVIMTWIDKVAYMCAQNYAERISVATASMDQMKFIKPVHMGDQVAIQARVSYTEGASIEIDVTLYKENAVTKEKKLVGLAYLHFVALDNSGKKVDVPQLKLETTEDIVRYNNAYARRILRLHYKKISSANQDQANLPPVKKLISKISKFDPRNHRNLQLFFEKSRLKVKIQFQKTFRFSNGQD
jgi:acyl-CoA hydrolase